MARPKKEQQTEQVNFDEQIYQYMGEFKSSLVKAKLKDNDLKKLIQRLLIEWAQGRVNL